LDSPQSPVFQPPVERVSRDIRSVSSSIVFGLAISSVRSILLFRILPPAVLGAWKTALIADTVSEFARLGVNRGLEVQVPYHDARGETQAASEVISTAATFSLGLGLFYGIAVFIAGWLVEGPELRAALWALAVIMTVLQPYFFLRDLAYARQRFALRTRENVLRSAADAVAAVAGAATLGIAGLGAGTALVVVASALYLMRAQAFRFHRGFSLSRLRSMIRIGLPYSLAEAAFELLRRLDVLMIAVLLGSESVGYYGISLLILDTASVVARRGVSQVLSSHLMRAYGRTGSHRAVASYFEAPARLFSYLLPPVLGAGSFFIGDFVRWVLPQYQAGIAAAEVTMWAIFFVAMHATLSSFFVAAARMGWSLKYFLLVLPVAALAQWMVAHAGWGIVGVAWATVGSLALLSTGEMAVARTSCGHSKRHTIAFLATTYLPIAIAMPLRFLVEAAGDGWPLPVGVAPYAKAVLFLVLMAPLVAAYEMKFSLLRLVRRAR
jgi:O-antigen/teichoic acid export membrane protein